MTTGTSRRTRAGAGTPAELRIDGTSYPCQAENVSLTGVLLHGSLPSTHARHTAVELTLTAPGADAGLRLSVSGRIVRTEVDATSGGTRLALEFANLSPEASRTLEALIARAALESMPLPQRIQLASRAQAPERERLMLDPQPAVIDGLVRNPGLVLPELLAILRRPGLLPQTLEWIGRDARWSANDQVRVLVAGHPSTPQPVAESIAAALGGSALELLVRAPGLRSTLRDKLLKRLPGRSRRR